MVRPLLSLSLWFVLAFSAQAQSFTLRYSSEVLKTRFTGRVFVIVTSKTIGAGVHPQNIYFPEPFLAQDVVSWAPDTALVFKPAFAFPSEKFASDDYHVQAVMDRDQGGINPFTAPGNLYSKAKKIELGGKKDVAVELTIDQIVPSKILEPKEAIRSIELLSKHLSKFHGKPMYLRAGVLLPASYTKDLKHRFPTIYEIPGFSGDHHLVHQAQQRKATDVAGVEMIHVTLDPNCRLGHHVFADSANNGPVGKALVEELIPYLQKNFRMLKEPHGRFLTGHSSGGWSSLWLQTTYPDFFGGVWSTAPDSVDFRWFQGVNIYPPNSNMLYDESKALRPLGRKGKEIWFHYKTFSDMERAFGRSGQLSSFEAVFSPKDANGKPKQLWDRSTGKIDAAVAQAWRQYDIREVLETNWRKLGPKLKGKLHVYIGDADNFYLDGAVKLLQKSLKDLKSDAVVEIFPGKDHSTLMDAGMRKRIHEEMAKTFRAGK